MAVRFIARSSIAQASVDGRDVDCLNAARSCFGASEYSVWREERREESGRLSGSQTRAGRSDTETSFILQIISSATLSFLHRVFVIRTKLLFDIL